MFYTPGVPHSSQLSTFTEIPSQVQLFRSRVGRFALSPLCSPPRPLDRVFRSRAFCLGFDNLKQEARSKQAAKQAAYTPPSIVRVASWFRQSQARGKQPAKQAAYTLHLASCPAPGGPKLTRTMHTRPTRVSLVSASAAAHRPSSNEASVGVTPTAIGSRLLSGLVFVIGFSTKRGPAQPETLAGAHQERAGSEEAPLFHAYPLLPPDHLSLVATSKSKKKRTGLQN